MTFHKESCSSDFCPPTLLEQSNMVYLSVTVLVSVLKVDFLESNQVILLNRPIYCFLCG